MPPSSYWVTSMVMSVMPSYGVGASCYGDWGNSPVAVRVGFVKCEYCTTSQKRPDDGRCCACGGPTPHVDEAIYAR